MSFFPPPHAYPQARHTEEKGETSAWWRPQGTPHDIEYANGGSCDYLVTGAVSRGDYGLYRWNMAAGKGGPDPHFHRTVSESFFVIDGTIQIFDGTDWKDARAGDFCFVPEGGIHGFRNESGEPASMLILFSPGAPREKYFEGLAEIGATGQRPSDEQMAEFFAAHDTYWL
jgi:mannose-6-phosphate isomerase-like protein (cupin superfamily)